MVGTTRDAQKRRLTGDTGQMAATANTPKDQTNPNVRVSIRLSQSNASCSSSQPRILEDTISKELAQVLCQVKFGV